MKESATEMMLRLGYWDQDVAKEWGKALIEIAAAFGGERCMHCYEGMCEGCWDYCPGLLARRALGVA